jgi:hypothetical protein
VISARHLSLRRWASRRSALRSVGLVALVALLLAATPGTSHAGTKTLARAGQNLLFFPFDIALSPFTSAKITYDSWRSSDDTKAVKYGYALFAPIWAFSIEAGASVIRGVAGALELLPGIALLPFKTDMNALYELPETQPAWVDTGTEGFKVRFGINYLTASGG